MIISLDISTTCTGVALYNDDAELIFADYVDLSKVKDDDYFVNLMKKTQHLLNYIYQKIDVADYKLTNIVIERPLGASNNINTCMLLAEYNMLIASELFKQYNIHPTYMAVAEWRKIFGIKCKKGEDKKVIFAKEAKKRFPNLTFTLNKRGKIDKKNFDMTDAICIGIAFFKKYLNIEVPIKQQVVEL